VKVHAVDEWIRRHGPPTWAVKHGQGLRGHVAHGGPLGTVRQTSSSFPERFLIEEGEQLVRPPPWLMPSEPAVGVSLPPPAPTARGKVPMGLFVSETSHGNLPQMILAFRALGALSRRLDSGERYRHQETDNRNGNEDLDQGHCAPAGGGCSSHGQRALKEFHRCQRSCNATQRPSWTNLHREWSGMSRKPTACYVCHRCTRHNNPWRV
jgi:hypothetical protein